MAADLHIHAADESITEAHMAAMFSNLMGSKWFNPKSIGELEGRTEEEKRRGLQLHQETVACPSIWIGEVSWLKAGLLDDPDTFVPAPVQAIADLIGEELPVIDDELISKIMAALDLPNATDYLLANPAEVRTFLEEHRGKRAFTISW